MNNDMTLFEAVYSILKENDKKPFAKECLEEIEQGTIIFKNKHVLKTSKMKNEMYTHYQVQENVTKANVEGYQDLLRAIDIYLGDEVREVGISAEQYGYVVLCNEINNDLIGILRSPHTNVHSAIETYNGALKIGIQLDYQKIHKMKLQSW